MVVCYLSLPLFAVHVSKPQKPQPQIYLLNGQNVNVALHYCTEYCMSLLLILLSKLQQEATKGSNKEGDFETNLQKRSPSRQGGALMLAVARGKVGTHPIAQ